MANNRSSAPPEADCGLERKFDELEEQGFTIVTGLASAEQIAALREQVQLALLEDWRRYRSLPGKSRHLALDLTCYGGAFLQLLENERMHRVFSHFLGETCILYSFTSTVLQPGSRQPACEIHTDTPRLIPGYHLGILMTLALDEFTEENGATYYLPGSHKSMERPSPDSFYASAVRVTRNAGDAVFFHPRVWHAGGLNHTDSTRSGCTVYACRSWMRQRFDFPRMISPEIVAELGPRGRSFLGFDVRTPAGMSEFYVPPDRRLYKPGQG